MNENKPGKQYWQSLQELAETPAVRAAIENEFPGYNPGEMVNHSRRKFLQLAGASMALAGITLTGCRRWPKENVVTQSSRPQGRIPGEPESYATAMELGGFAQPLLVTTYDGRPIKVEGNPLHPACATFGGKLGASTIHAQASLLDMYDPERSRAIIQRKSATHGDAVSADTFLAAAREQLAKHKTDGSKIAILIEETRSLNVADALARFIAAFPGAKVYDYNPLSRDNQFLADKLAFGKPVRQVLNLKDAKVVVSFDADLLGLHPYALRHANDWAQNRKSADVDGTMNRMYVVESTFSTTGTVADERYPARVRLIESMVLQLAHKAGLESAQSSLGKPEIELVDRMWADLSKNQGKVVIAGGSHLQPEVLGVISAINARLGAIGSTITLRPEADRPAHVEQLKTLVSAMNAGQIETLLILGGNPVYDAPADLDVAKGLAEVAKRGTTIHLSLYENETSVACQWHVNRAHYLESWGDSQAWDGSVCLQQPMIKPLFDGFTTASLLCALTGETTASVLGIDAKDAHELSLDQAIFYRTFAKQLNEKFVANSAALKQALHDGFIKAGAPVAFAGAVQKPNATFTAAAGDFDVRLVPDYTMYDGQFANNGWLQECPDPVTKITWDNAALINYLDAKELGIQQDDYSSDQIEISLGDRKIRIVAYVVPGQPKGVITLPLGYGRTRAGAVLLNSERAGSIGSGIGFDTYDFRTTQTMGVGFGAKVSNTGTRYNIAHTQTHHIIEPMGFKIREDRVGAKSVGGKIVHESTLEAFNKDAHAPHKAAHTLLNLQLFPEPYTNPPKHDGATNAFNDPHAWGMSMDMNACIGCQACVMACQSENNIPVVGKDMVIRNREMHWIRIDRYFKSEGKTYEEQIADPNPQVTHQPMTCVHCENAPCEQVCPVAATVHDSEGINTMVYNRCIGTRYCANNCPYKVRKFNYLDYHSKHPRDGFFPWLGIPDTQQEQSVDKIHRLVYNPEVTVRMRGVMEKCTYCVQRIKKATIDRRNQWINGERSKPTVDDFDIVTACQQVCPTEAIIFGDLNDPNSLVSKAQAGKRSYKVLQELNNRPRTAHLAKLRNPSVEPSVKEEVH